MRKEILGTLAVLVTVAAATTFSQSGKPPTRVTYVTAEEICALFSGRSEIFAQ